MSAPDLTIDLDAIAANWAALDARSAPEVETAAVVKADAYGLGAAQVAPRLAAAGARSFFVATAAEAAALRRVLQPGPRIFVFNGFMAGDGPLFAASGAIPLINSPAQATAFAAERPGAPAGLQIDTGMSRLGVQPSDLGDPAIAALDPVLTISHLACADTPDAAENAAQLAAFRARTVGADPARLSLAATGGILMGAGYHFALTRPGIGLYGGAPFTAARPVVALDLPVIQVRDIPAGAFVGYGAAWRAARPSRIATLAAGYADGLIRAMGGAVRVWAGEAPCPSVGRLSMDLLTVDVTDLPQVPDRLSLLGPRQGIDAVAAAAGTIGYEVLIRLGPRLHRVYIGA